MSSSKKHGKALTFFRRPLFGYIYWKRIWLTDGVDKSSSLYRNAKKSSRKHPKPTLPAFTFTEARPEWTLLYNLARVGQINPRNLKYMKRKDLYYLAGMGYPHPDLVKGSPQQIAELTKLQGNVDRAKRELARRDFFWRSVVAVTAAFAGGALAIFARSL